MLKLKKTHTRYPAYKPSGIEWIWEIPEEWEMKPFKKLFQLKKDLVGDGHSKYKVLSLTLKGVIPRNMDDNFGKFPKEFDAYQIVRPNDLVFCLFDYDVTPRTVWRAEEEWLLTGAYTAFSPKSASSRYFYYYYLSLDISKELLHLCTWLRNALNKDMFKSMKNPVPTYQEQEFIADYLDEKTALIDVTIGKKRRQIELLNERRTALINRAVTKGLDPKAKMNDSGLEWIWEIPERWEIRRIKQLSNVRRWASPRPIDDPIYFNDNGEYAWTRIADVSASNKYLLEAPQKLSDLWKSLSVPLEPGEIFVSIAGTVGKPIISGIKCCIHDGFVYFPKLKYDKELLYWIFAGWEAYKGLWKLWTQLNLNSDTIGNISIPLPSENEQKEIVAFLNRETALIDEMVSKIERSIELLNEYRSSLISSVVTGKVKV